MVAYKGAVLQDLSDFVSVFDRYSQEVKIRVQRRVAKYGREIRALKAQNEEYSQIARVLVIGLRYLKNGRVQISAKDKKEVGSDVSKLQQIVNFNKKLKKARETAAKNKKSAAEYAQLEREKSAVEKRYGAVSAQAEEQYGKAVFEASRIRALQRIPKSEYRTALDEMDSNPEKFEKLRDITFYNGQPTLATIELQKIFNGLFEEDALDLFGKSLFAELDAFDTLDAILEEKPSGN